jgi:hypothetical protein
MRRTLLPITLAALAALAAPGPAAAADVTVAPDPAAQAVTALDGTLVWVTEAASSQRLMQRSPDGTIAPVEGAPTARAYRSIDLGRDRRNRLVLTYQRCATLTRCKTLQDDLQGRRSSIRGLALSRCTPTAALAVWRTRVAYGLACRKADRTEDAKRSGLYVKTGSHTSRRLPLPRDAVRFGVNDVSSVDLRGTRVGAIVSDIFEYAFSETTAGRSIRSTLVAASEGESDEHALGLSLAPAGEVWSLTDAEHAGDPNQAVLVRQAGGDCVEIERFANAAGPEQETGFRVTDVAVDRGTVYLLVPGTGVVTHTFVPERACAS